MKKSLTLVLWQAPNMFGGESTACVMQEWDHNAFTAFVASHTQQASAVDKNCFVMGT